MQKPLDIATRTSWETHPIDQPKRIDIDLQFTKDQVAQMKIGLIPQQMEDKWFIFSEDEWLYFHRSWSGFGIYKARLDKLEDRYTIKEFFAERNQEKYRNEDDDYDIETLFVLIARGLLNIDAGKIYTAVDIITDKKNVIREWSSLGRMLFS